MVTTCLQKIYTRDRVMAPSLKPQKNLFANKIFTFLQKVILLHTEFIRVIKKFSGGKSAGTLNRNLKISGLAAT
jgi:hypothetical protein